MSLIAIVFVLLGAGLGWANGANDVSKGVATLVGSGVTTYRRAIWWGALWTGAGGLLGASLAGAMVHTFGSGLLSDQAAPSFATAAAVLTGAGAWVLVATRTGLPVSTTHAIVGSLAGVTVVAHGLGGLQWAALGSKILVPLLVSPLVSAVAVILLVRLARARDGAGVPGADCLCATLEPAPPALALSGGGAWSRSLATERQVPRLVAGTAHACAVHEPRALRVTVDHLHWLTSGATSLARGMNDAPKIVALVVAAATLDRSDTLPMPLLFAVVSAVMLGGSLVGGRRVTHVLAEEVTVMNAREGFIANLVTSMLVFVGATAGLAMSTTHVSSGGIAGAGAGRGSLDRRTLRSIALAWLVTLPAAALLGIATYGVLAVLGA